MLVSKTSLMISFVKMVKIHLLPTVNASSRRGQQFLTPIDRYVEFALKYLLVIHVVQNFRQLFFVRFEAVAIN